MDAAGYVRTARSTGITSARATCPTCRLRDFRDESHAAQDVTRRSGAAAGSLVLAVTGTPCGRGSRRVVYRQGGRQATVETLDLLAIRWAEGRRDDVRRALVPFGRVTEFQSQRIFVLHPRDRASLNAARSLLQEFQARRAVEFATPVLRDPQSDTHQILTDEITVRFHGDKPTSKVKSLLAKYGLRLLRRNEFRPNQYLVSVPDPSGLKTLEAAGELDASEEVEFAAPNFISQIKR